MDGGLFCFLYLFATAEKKKKCVAGGMRGKTCHGWQLPSDSARKNVTSGKHATPCMFSVLCTRSRLLLSAGKQATSDGGRIALMGYYKYVV